jgi:hypothetical protein
MLVKGNVMFFTNILKSWSEIQDSAAEKKATRGMRVAPWETEVYGTLTAWGYRERLR